MAKITSDSKKNGTSTQDIYSEENAIRVFKAMRKQAVENGVSDLSMEEIDKEIAEVRKSKSYGR